ncbi:MAG TPA: marine proteobacterial sortase target protein [Steroidobacteraceae bacterium]|nr:marine proteobacterial sortase target protein [Steroidobacteraceae bacterium]
MGASTTRKRNERQLRDDFGTEFHARRGTGEQPFPQRLARARLLHLRRRDTAANWLALTISIALYFLLSSSPVHANPMDGVRAGSLLLRGRGTEALQPAMRVDTEVDAQVSGMIARVTVRQVFRNAGADWMDGVYVFPLSEKSAVDRLEMHIGERVIVGEIREREAARKVFEQAQQAGKQASLVEQERPNLFTTSVANVPPGETVTIEIGYLEALDYDHGHWNLRIPLTLTPRYVPGGSATESTTSVERSEASRALTGFGTRPADADRITPPVDQGSADSQRVSIHVNVDAGFRLGSLRSLYHAVQVRDSQSIYQVELVEHQVPADRDFELTWSPDVGAATGAAVFTERFGADTYGLLMLVPPHEERTLASPPREVIYIIDTSGSMEGNSIRQARAALQLALGRLGSGDLFNVIRFSDRTETLYADPVPASREHLDQALEYVGALQANGGTEMLPALQAAFRMRASAEHLRQIVFITDGAVGNEEELFALIRTLGAARLFTVGIGAAPNGHFMRTAAAMGRGTFTFIGTDGDVKERMGELFEKIERPALTDIELGWPNGTKAELSASRVPDVYYGEPVVLTARLNSAPRGFVTMSGRSASGFWMRQIPLASARANAGVASLWARNRIEDLLDQKRAGANPDTIREQVLSLALEHKLVSPYTSLVAVDRKPVRPAGIDSVQSAIPHTAPAGSAWAGVQVGYPNTATPARLHLLIGLALLLAALMFIPRSAWARA